jgi:glycosyltransferase involved in cell wall biosynthesis
MSGSVESPVSPADASPAGEGKRFAFVLPRFGEDVVGGAELFGRWLAERLAADGHAVDVITTCARDHSTWKNEYPPGSEQLGKLTVHRFPINERDAAAHATLERSIVNGTTLSRDEEIAWFRNGVSSSAMEEFIAANADRYDLVFGLPYLWGTTFFAYERVPDKFVLVPCLHDEPYARVGVVAEMLAGCKGLMFHTEPEADVAQRLAGQVAPWAVVGLGFDPPPAVDVDAVKSKYGLHDPYVLYVGRREGGKSTPLLIDYFQRYKARRTGNMRLVLVGSGDDPPDSPDIKVVDIDWSDRHAVMAGAIAFCHPSTNESLSVVLLQAWLAGTAAMVNGYCEVTKYHCERSNGGLWFLNYADFEAILDRYVEAPRLRQRLGESGREYVEREYSWPVVLQRFYQAVTEWSAAESVSAR